MVPRGPGRCARAASVLNPHDSVSAELLHCCHGNRWVKITVEICNYYKRGSDLPTLRASERLRPRSELRHPCHAACPAGADGRHHISAWCLLRQRPGTEAQACGCAHRGSSPMPPQLHSGCGAAKGLRHRGGTSSRPQRMRCVQEAAEIPGDSQTLQLMLVRAADTATYLVLSPSLSSACLAGMDAVVVSVLKHKYSKGRNHSDRPDTPCSLPPLTYHPDTGSLHTDRSDASVHAPHLHPLQENVAWSHCRALWSSAALSGPSATTPLLKPPRAH